MENNDHLTKVHKEILDQKSKMERAEREMKSSRKDASQNLNNKEFLSNFDVSKQKMNKQKIGLFFLLERFGSERKRAPKQCGSDRARRNGRFSHWYGPGNFTTFMRKRS